MYHSYVPDGTTIAQFKQEDKVMKGQIYPDLLEDALPFDTTEAPPLPNVEYLSKGDIVRYERLNDFGEVIMFAIGQVINTNCHAQKVQLFVNSTLRFWVDVASVGLLKVTANAAVETAVFAA